MSTTATKLTESVQDGILKAIETGQRLTLEAVGAAVSTIDSVLPQKEFPFADIIAPKEAIASGFRFAERLLDVQKGFLTELVTIAAPTPAAPAKRGA